MIDLNELDPTAVEVASEFGAIKPVKTILRVKAIEWQPVEGKDYPGRFTVQTEFTTSDGIEPVDASTTPGAPITNLYIHSQGALGMVRQFVEALGGDWQAFASQIDRSSEEAYIQSIAGALQEFVGREGLAKINLVTHRRDTGEPLDEPRNEVRWRKK